MRGRKRVHKQIGESRKSRIPHRSRYFVAVADADGWRLATKNAQDQSWGLVVSQTHAEGKGKGKEIGEGDWRKGDGERSTEYGNCNRIRVSWFLPLSNLQAAWHDEDWAIEKWGPWGARKWRDADALWISELWCGLWLIFGFLKSSFSYCY